MQLIWGNSHILRKNKPIWLSVIINSNIDYVSQLIDRIEHRFLMWEQLTDQYGHNLDWLMYESIKAAIPQSWKQIIKYQTVENEPITKCDTIAGKDKVVQYVYWDLINRTLIETSIREMWNVKLKVNLDQSLWSEICQSIIKVSNCIKMHNFQYRILHKSVNH